MAADESGSDSSSGVCILRKYYTCGAPEAERVLRCERTGCAKFIHRSCSERLTEPFRDASLPLPVVCGKRCYNAKSKVRGNALATLMNAAGGVAGGSNTTTVVTERKKRSQWNSDGPNPSVNSLSVLLEWLRVPSNYARWKNGGDGIKFETKSGIASQILQQIRSHGIVTDRNANDVFAKIYLLEKSFTDAAEWLRDNGNTTLDRARVGIEVRKRCAYYYDLVESMGQDFGTTKTENASTSSTSTNNSSNSTTATDSTESGSLAVPSRKRPSTGGSETETDAKKQQLVVSDRELWSRVYSDLTNQAMDINTKIAARVAAAKKAVVDTQVLKVPIPTTTIAPALASAPHSFLKPMTTNTPIASKPATSASTTSSKSSTITGSTDLATLHASLVLASAAAAVSKSSVTPPIKAKPTAAVPMAATTSKPAEQNKSSNSSSSNATTTSTTTATTSPQEPSLSVKPTENGVKLLTTSASATVRTISSTSSTTSTSIPMTTSTSPPAPSTVETTAKATTPAMPLGFNASMLAVNNSMLQATAEKLQAEAKFATITANTALLRARKQLRDEGIPQDEIDAVLPLQRH
ncbi:hypothetical protein FI667_g5519, partial [Globisporangium splendens]